MKTKAILFSLFVIFCTSCNKTQKEYYDNGKIKSIKYYKNNSDRPLRVEYYDNKGILEAEKEFNSVGALTLENKKLEDGSSLLIQYFGKELSFIKETTPTGEIFNYSMENEKKEGVGRLYKNNTLLSEALFYYGDMFAFNEIKQINKGEVVVVNRSNYTMSSDTIANQIFDKQTVLYHMGKDGEFIKDGFYLQGNLDNKKDTIFGIYAKMELKDTARVGEITEVIVNGGSIDYTGKFLEFKINVSKDYIDILDEKVFRSQENNLLIRFKVIFKKEGYNYLSGYASIKDANSEWSNRFLVFDDIYIDAP